MLIFYPGPITVPYWYMLELRSKQTSEETVKRLGKALKSVFQDDGAELFIPVIVKDQDPDPGDRGTYMPYILLTECYIFVHADDPQKVAKLRKVTGVYGVVAKNESLNPAKFLKVEGSYVEGLIQQCRDAYNARASTIQVGSWVRLVDGQTRNYCGLVVSSCGGRVLVQIDLKTKILVVETNLHNLLDLSHVPLAHRVFYYSGPVKKFLEENGLKGEEQLKNDLLYNEAEARAFLQPVPYHSNPPAAHHRKDPARHTSREQTPTRFVRSLVEGGDHCVQHLLTQTVGAIRSGAIRSPKNALILWSILRGSIVRVLMPAASDGKGATYTQLMSTFGKEFQLTPSDVHIAMPELPFRPGTEHWLPLPSSLIKAELEAGNYNIGVAVRKVELGLQNGELQAPKNLEAFAWMIRQQVVRFFKSRHPGVGLRELAEMYHNDLRLNAVRLRQMFPSLEFVINECRARQMQQVEEEVTSTGNFVWFKASSNTEFCGSFAEQEEG